MVCPIVAAATSEAGAGSCPAGVVAPDELKRKVAVLAPSPPPSPPIASAPPETGATAGSCTGAGSALVARRRSRSGALERAALARFAGAEREAPPQPPAALHPQDLVRERGYVAHVDLRAHDATAGRQGAQRGGHERPRRGEDDRGV